MKKYQLRKPSHFIALGFGSGLLRPAPGTWGTLASVPVYLMLAQLPQVWYAVVLLIAFALGVWACGQAAADAGVHDDGALVWDEFVGFWLTMLLLPVTLTNVVLGFFLFRLFDIVKPWPIRWFDKQVSGGMGIMIDDVIAGIFACAVLHGLQPLLNV